MEEVEEGLKLNRIKKGPQCAMEEVEEGLKTEG